MIEAKRFSQWAATLLLMVATALLTLPVSARADECELDKMMGDARVQMDKMAVGIFENGVRKPIGSAIENAPTVKDASCLAILDQLDSLMRMRIPSVGGAMGMIFSKIKDMACKMADSYLRDIAGKMTVNVSDPLGIASVGIGLGSGGQGAGVSVETYDFGKVVEDAAMQAGQQVLGGSMGSVGGNVMNKIPSGVLGDRSKRVEDTVNKGVHDAINGL